MVSDHSLGPKSGFTIFGLGKTIPQTKSWDGMYNTCIKNLKKSLTRLSLNIIIGLPIETLGVQTYSTVNKDKELQEKKDSLKIFEKSP